MEGYEYLSLDNLDALRDALAIGDVSLYEIEQAIQQRIDDELSKPVYKVDGDLVERLEKMLQIPFRVRLNGNGAPLQPRSFNEIMEAIREKGKQ